MFMPERHDTIAAAALKPSICMTRGGESKHSLPKDGSQSVSLAGDQDNHYLQKYHYLVVFMPKGTLIAKAPQQIRKLNRSKEKRRAFADGFVIGLTTVIDSHHCYGGHLGGKLC